MIFETSLLSTAYFPPIEYFAAMANSRRVEIESGEMYQKQSYRTRCHINGANGLLVLTVPVLRSAAKDEGGSHKVPTAELKIDYTKPWILQHKRALEAAYMSSPFFEYYMDEIYEILDSGEESLLKMNTALTVKIAGLIGIETPVSLSDGNFIIPGSEELKARGIRMMSMNPGWVKTEFFNHALQSNQGEVQYYDRLYEAADVVATGLKDLYKTKKDFSIHGFPVRMQVRLVKLLPHSMVMNTWLNQQKKPKNNRHLTVDSRK